MSYMQHSKSLLGIVSISSKSPDADTETDMLKLG